MQSLQQNSYNLFIVFFLALAVALAVTAAVRRLAIQLHIGEEPDSRKVHSQFMPHMGGIGIFSGFLSAIILFVVFYPGFVQELFDTYWVLLLASLLIVALGVYDDLKGLNPGRKMLGQVLIVSLLVFNDFRIESLHIPFYKPLSLGILSIPISYLWLIGVSNAVNLLDGLDGLAAGFSAIVSAVLAVVSWQYGQPVLFILSLAVLAGTLGFLKFNYHPAKIFMGDTGSLFLGLILAALSLKIFEILPGRINFTLPLLILAIPIGDTAIAFFRRLNSGKHPFKPDKDHLHHRLIYLGLSHQQAVLIIYAATIVYAVSAYVIIIQTTFISAILLIIIIFISAFSLYRVGYLEAKRHQTFYGEEETIVVEKDIAPLSLTRLIHKFFFMISDLLAINMAFIITWWIRYKSGIFELEKVIPFVDFWITPLPLILSVFWLILFQINDLYNLRWDVSRFDHLRSTGKVLLFGGVILFILTMDPGALLSKGRLVLLLYILIILGLISLGRLFVIQIEKIFSILEYSGHKTLLIGTSEKGRKLVRDITANPHLLYEFVGYVSKEFQNKKFYELSCLGTYKDIPDIVRRYGIEEIIIAVNERSRDEILNIVAQAEKDSLVFKILPQLYDIISGHKTAEVIGHPLIRLFPNPMHLWQWVFKRLFDILLAGVLLIILVPVFLVAVFFQAISGISPLMRIDNMVGKNGRRFGLLNLNTESAGRNTVGRLLYNSRFYKFPALVNIFLGQMSFIGPRPEEEELVIELRSKIKFYNRRFQIRPGLTGWAQVKYRYEEALKFKKEQLKQDLYYLENMSLTFDIRIFLRSVIIFFLGKRHTA